ncbi:High mobility group protein 20A [Tolypocladium ophioglossoides CBS 100239]|uniref:High mobility group protein 20A n=1 Tax=Tolypocladium ophioglossoides (strain CBS 100239) TaxID=1163406 RepID=A0A0L0NL99_TOLOC|nr:High mobility group protein 20A [Tolypocladium ophioglossoides CBS 100239]
MLALALQPGPYFHLRHHSSVNYSSSTLRAVQSGCMTQGLDSIFAELGLTQYLDAFVDQGFDAWDTILDIQESDLDALGVKLGHRRKLQRRIANARGIDPSVSLVSLKPAAEEPKPETLRRESSRTEGSNESNGVTKRKYRRHPKPDENAPERPPSAYVLFSNKMREDLKSQNLTFTEIAKLVGENWQSLASAEKETYESQANAAKENYHRDLAEYKKTTEYRRYAQYLHDFKDKQTKQNRGHDASKRPKLEPVRLRHGSTSSSATPNGASGSGSGSSSERLQGSEPPPTRQERVNSTASMAGSQHSSTAPTPISHHKSIEEPGPSPRTSHFESGSPGDPHHSHSRQSAWTSRNRAGSGHQHLPSLSDMLDDGNTGMDTLMTDGNSFAAGSGQLRLVADGPPVLPPARVPRLHHEPSSGSADVSGSSTGNFLRIPGEGPLPIHALLTDRAMIGTSEFDKPLVPAISAVANPNGQRNRAPGRIHGPMGYGFQAESSAFQHMQAEQSGEGDVLMTVEATPNGKDGFDGMSALLRAGEIVGRRGRQ